MLEGIAANTIVAGAYTDGRGGICPMLAAHRHGGCTSFLSVGRVRADGGGPARLATRVARPHRAARPLARRRGGPPGRRHRRAPRVDGATSAGPAGDPRAPAQATSSTSRSSPSGENGLVRKRSTPAPRARDSTFWSLWPVSITMRQSAVDG